ncbi:MAG: M57 family metalloprotease [Gelidibacter sp.]
MLSVQSCQKEESAVENVASEKIVSPELLEKIAALDLNTSGVRMVDFLLPDGTTQERIQVEDDIFMTENEIDAMRKPAADDGGMSRNYRTYNLVTQGRVISIVGYTGGGGQGLSNKERTALQRAVNNYNSLSNVSISFQLTFSSDYASKDMVVYHNPSQSGAGGSAGFPSNGRPHKFVQIHGLENYSTNVVQHVIAHEIGHSIGFRHTDWFNRASCGQNSNEGVGQIGAVDLGGNNPNSSIMLACFSANASGNFGVDDVKALQKMY